MSTKFVIIVAEHQDADKISSALVAHQYEVTRMGSTGGFLRRGNVTLMVGVEENIVPSVLDVVRFACPENPLPDQHHATIFVINSPLFEQI